jgi:imidazolonepropionase-like amidohydrolase
MLRALGFALTLLQVSALSLDAHAASKAIRFGRLWDGHRVIANATVIVENDKVQRVIAGDELPTGANVIDLRAYTGHPGLIDAHTHITYYWNGAPDTTPRRQPPRHIAVTVFLAQENAKNTLQAGVTTVRDLNAAGGADIAMRDLINMGAMVGPRMFVSGTGLRSSANRPGVTDPAAKAARQATAVIESGADWVKVFGSTGGFDNVTGDQTVSYEELNAIVGTRSRSVNAAWACSLVRPMALASCSCSDWP